MGKLAMLLTILTWKKKEIYREKIIKTITNLFHKNSSLIAEIRPKDIVETKEGQIKIIEQSNKIEKKALGGLLNVFNRRFMIEWLNAAWI